MDSCKVKESPGKRETSVGSILLVQPRKGKGHERPGRVTSSSWIVQKGATLGMLIYQESWQRVGHVLYMRSSGGLRT